MSPIVPIVGMICLTILAIAMQIVISRAACNNSEMESAEAIASMNWSKTELEVALDRVEQLEDENERLRELLALNGIDPETRVL